MKRLVHNFILAVLLLPLSQGRRASISSPIRSLVAADATVAKKRQLKLPRFGRRSDDADDGVQQKKNHNADSSADDKESTRDKSAVDGTDAQDDSLQSSDEPTDKSNPDETHTADNTDKDAEDTNNNPKQPHESQTTNSTRPSIVLMPPPHPHPMRPMQPHPYYMPHHPSHRRHKKPSLLSSILSSLIPKQSPPTQPHHHPFSPNTNPYTPQNEVGSTLFSLLLRLTLLSLSTHLLDLFGPSDTSAFIPSPAQHYTFERINDRYRRDGNALSLALGSAPPGVRRYRWRRVWNQRRKEVVGRLSEVEGGDEQRQLLQLQHSHEDSTKTTSVPTIENGGLYNKTVIILDIKPDARVGNGMAEHLRDTVSFIIEQHRDHLDKRRAVHSHRQIMTPHNNNSRTAKGIRSALGTNLEVLLLLDSPGGTVSDYGLASSQLRRLRNEPHITLSVCIDRIAASGGYMMACQATPGHLYAAPFAMVGSIGVLMETVNFNDILNKYGVKPLTIKAGRHKAPLKSLGEVTDEEMGYAQKDADAIHGAFQRHVLEARPNVVPSKEWIDRVCTGSVFLGKEAVELGLVDQVKTSDEYVAERIAAGDRVLRLIPYKGPQFALKLSPLDLLLSGMDAEGRAKIWEVIQGARSTIASICRVGGAVGVLNAVHHMASIALRANVCWTN